MSTFAKIRRWFGGHEKEESLSVEVVERTGEQMQTLGKAAEGFIGALSELEEIYPCPCGNMFLCRHKTCPQCGAVNPKYKEFTDEDQRRGQIKVDAALDNLREVRKAL